MPITIARQKADIKAAIKELDIYIDEHDCGYWLDGTCAHDQAIDRRGMLIDAYSELEAIEADTLNNDI